MENGPELLNVRETARRLVVHENTVRNWVRQGLLRDSRVPGSRFHRFRVEDVERLVAQRGEAADSLQTERRNVNPELVSAAQLAQWPSTRARDAQATFPELIRRLIGETPGATVVSMPSGDAVSTPGFDGVIDVDKATTYLPAGRILIELGVSEDVRTKATADYRNRTGPGNADCIFLFATPRRWPGAQAWAAEHRAEGNFRDVRAIDAHQLEGWLDHAPSAHHWISEHLGLRPRDAITLDTWWQRLSTSTDPILPAGLCGAGRAAEMDSLLQHLNEESPRLTSIECEWHKDGIGFIHAALHTSGQPLAVLPAPLIIESAEVWDRVVERPGQAILIPQFDDADIDAALNSGHHVLAVIDSSNPRRRAVDIRLPRIGCTEASEAFQQAPLEWPAAGRLAGLARRSLPALIRNCSRNPQVRQPDWAEPSVAEWLAPLVLAGKWRSRPGDHEALAQLAGRPWVDLEPVVARAAQGPDPLLRQVGDHWELASPEEAYLVLGEKLTAGAIQRWQGLIQEVLLEADPFHGMSETERLYAQMNGVQQKYSATLKGGLTQGIAMVGAISESFGRTRPASDDTADVLVHRLLDAARLDSTGEPWAELSGLLPLLAEASPEEFLNALDDELDSPDPAIGHLFVSRDDKLALGPTTRHSSLLWALEQLCWSPEYLVRGAQTLTKLCRFELPDNMGNRPLNSLTSILCGWVRNTDADMDTRLAAIDAVRSLNGDIGWKLIQKLWPKLHETSFPPSRPRFRMLKSGNRDVRTAEWLEFISALVDRAVLWSSDEPQLLPDLVDRLNTLPGPDRDRVIDHLETHSDDADHEVRLALFNELQDLVSTHEEFATADWALPESVRVRLQRLRDHLEPADDLRRLSHLFDWHPVLSGFKRRDFEEYQAELQRQRDRALEELFQRPDPATLLADIARRAKAPSQLGWSLAKHDLPVDTAIAWLKSTDEALIEVARNWLYRAMFDSEGALLAHLLARRPLGAQQLEGIVACVPPTSEHWRVLEDHPEADDAYWSTARIEVVDPSHNRVAIEKLMAHRRPWPAIAVAAFGLEDTATETGAGLTNELVAAILWAAVQAEPSASDVDQMTTYYVGKLLDFLERSKSSENELKRLELSFFRLMEHHRVPRALNRALASDPELYVELLALVYRGKNEKASADADKDGRATLAMWVLRGWHGFPGRHDDCTLNTVAMRDWVVRARLLLSDLDRTDIGDELIGESLAQSPSGDDGVWPPEPVRDLVETIGSRELENGLIIGRLNRRGVTTRPVYAGGQLERDEAERYRGWSSAMQGAAPRTARALRSIAESYERDAQREDRRAEIDQDRH